jgi:hypothetical protein
MLQPDEVLSPDRITATCKGAKTEAQFLATNSRRMRRTGGALKVLAGLFRLRSVQKTNPPLGNQALGVQARAQAIQNRDARDRSSVARVLLAPIHRARSPLRRRSWAVSDVGAFMGNGGIG